MTKISTEPRISTLGPIVKIFYHFGITDTLLLPTVLLDSMPNLRNIPLLSYYRVTGIVTRAYSFLEDLPNSTYLFTGCRRAGDASNCIANGA